MPNAPEPEREEEGTPALDAARAEAEIRAHNRLSPDVLLDPLAAVNLYVEAFLAGARYAAQPGGTR